MSSNEEMLLKIQKMSECAEATYSDSNLYFSENEEFFTQKRKDVVLADIVLLESYLTAIKTEVTSSEPPLS